MEQEVDYKVLYEKQQEEVNELRIQNWKLQQELETQTKELERWRNIALNTVK